jgi:molybdopterin-containing oxidoreductase family iron-sulfur binding subunit
MDENRRDFLKKAGVGSLVGLGVVSAIGFVAEKEGNASTTTSDTSGTRLGMVVDTRKCPPECTKCLEICHSVHNVPDFKLPDGSPDLKHEIKWIWKEPYHNAFTGSGNTFLSETQESVKVTVLCNHCSSPSCVRVCPTQATFKRADGIVMMDYHRCIGCRFCMAACPYGSRSFNWQDPREAGGKKVIGGRDINPEFPTRERGVVEKCNFCAERLAKNLKPACVEECPEGALTFGDLNNPNSEVRALLKSNNTFLRKPELGTGPSVFYIV